MLNAVDVGSVARFLPIIFNQLFHILVVTANEDVSLNVVRYVKLLEPTILAVSIITQAHDLSSLRFTGEVTFRIVNSFGLHVKMRLKPLKRFSRIDVEAI